MKVRLLDLPQRILQVVEHELLHLVIVCGPKLLRTQTHTFIWNGYYKTSEVQILFPQKNTQIYIQLMCRCCDDLFVSSDT